MSIIGKIFGQDSERVEELEEKVEELQENQEEECKSHHYPDEPSSVYYELDNSSFSYSAYNMKYTSLRKHEKYVCKHKGCGSSRTTDKHIGYVDENELENIMLSHEEVEEELRD
jgi:hypothetical protein